MRKARQPRLIINGSIRTPKARPRWRRSRCPAWAMPCRLLLDREGINAGLLPNISALLACVRLLSLWNSGDLISRCSAQTSTTVSASHARVRRGQSRQSASGQFRSRPQCAHRRPLLKCIRGSKADSGAAVDWQPLLSSRTRCIPEIGLFWRCAIAERRHQAATSLAAAITSETISCTSSGFVR